MTFLAKQSQFAVKRMSLDIASWGKLVLLICCGAIASLSLVNSAAAKNGYYQWKDAQGQMHFSQNPPSSQTNASDQPASEARFISTGYSGSFSNNENGATKQSFEGSSARKNSPPTKQSQSAAASTNSSAGRPFEKDQQRCDKAKRNLQQLSMTFKITLTDENGKQRLLSPEEKQQQRQAALKAIEESC